MTIISVPTNGLIMALARILESPIFRYGFEQLNHTRESVVLQGLNQLSVILPPHNTEEPEISEKGREEQVYAESFDDIGCGI